MDTTAGVTGEDRVRTDRQVDYDPEKEIVVTVGGSEGIDMTSEELLRREQHRFSKKTEFWLFQGIVIRICVWYYK